MANLDSLVNSITSTIQDSSYNRANIISRINDIVTRIAAGIFLPQIGERTPPLSELMDTDTVDTTTSAYASLPDDYQRNLFLVVDSNGDTVRHPKNGGSYYSFQMLLREAPEKDLSETGSVYVACVQGNKLYYQGIPSDAETLTLYFYRKPTDMANSADTPDGLPEHLHTRLIKHGVCMEIYGEGIEDGEDNQGSGTKYHQAKFYEALTDLVEFIGVDEKPYNIGDDSVHTMWMDEEQY